MGQKVHPTGIRLGVVKDHNSVWYADSKTYAQNLINDLEVREYILKKLDAASVSRVKIERPAQTARITIFTARPGIVIGKKGEDVDGLRKDLSAKMGVPVHINIEEIRKPDVDARLVAQNVAQQLERRVMFRRAMKRVVQTPCARVQKVSRCRWVADWVARRSREPSGTAKAACPCTPCVPTLTTRPTKHTPPTV